MHTQGKKSLQDFRIHSTGTATSKKYLLLSGFRITCCAADAYPVDQQRNHLNRQVYPPDTWLAQGQMITENQGQTPTN